MKHFFDTSQDDFRLFVLLNLAVLSLYWRVIYVTLGILPHEKMRKVLVKYDGHRCDRHPQQLCRLVLPVL